MAIISKHLLSVLEFKPEQCTGFAFRELDVYKGRLSDPQRYSNLELHAHEDTVI